MKVLVQSCPASTKGVIMPKFICSYAHDIACFADFVVEAKNERAAMRKVSKVLREGKFSNVDAIPAWANGATNKRVFVQGEADQYASDTTLAELIGEQHRFSAHTHRCLHCDRHADDQAADPIACRSLAPQDAVQTESSQVKYAA